MDLEEFSSMVEFSEKPFDTIVDGEIVNVGIKLVGEFKDRLNCRVLFNKEIDRSFMTTEDLKAWYRLDIAATLYADTLWNKGGLNEQK
jgi:hypothetical protein